MSLYKYLCRSCIIIFIFFVRLFLLSQYDFLYTFATRRLEWGGDVSTPLRARQYARLLALSLLHREDADGAVVWFHRGSPLECRAQVAYHCHVAKLFERTGFYGHAMSSLQTALMSELLSTVPRVDAMVRMCVCVCYLQQPPCRHFFTCFGLFFCCFIFVVLQAMLQSHIFHAALSRRDYNRAYVAAKQNPDKASGCVFLVCVCFFFKNDGFFLKSFPHYQGFSKDCVERLVVIMADSDALLDLPFSASEVALVCGVLLWKGWMVEATASQKYFYALFAFMTARFRYRQAAAAMWALYFRLSSQAGAAAAAIAALSTAYASLSLVPRAQAYLLGQDWCPRCTEPLSQSLLTVDDIRKVLVNSFVHATDAHSFCRHSRPTPSQHAKKNG